MKYAITVLLVAAGLIFYLNRAYAHIFSFLDTKNPGNPTTHTSFTISSPTSTTQLTYVALGDSLTAGIGARQETESYPYRLAELLANNRAAKVNLINLAQSGATTFDVLNRQIPLVSQLHPDIVTLAIGINDMHNRVPPAAFQKNLIAIVDSLASSTRHLNILTIPYLGSSSVFWPPYQTYFDWQTKHYNNLLRESLSSRNITFIDLYSLTHEQSFQDKNYYSPDGFHPSATTYYFWSKIIYDHLNY